MLDFVEQVMVGKSPITPLVEVWLKHNHKNYNHKELAEEIGCCVDTVKRALNRLGLEVIYGAKYQKRSKPTKWTRPCIQCGCKKPRPRLQYKCVLCHERQEDVDTHVSVERNRKVTLSDGTAKKQR